MTQLTLARLGAKVVQTQVSPTQIREHRYQTAIALPYHARPMSPLAAGAPLFYPPAASSLLDDRSSGQLLIGWQGPHYSTAVHKGRRVRWDDEDVGFAEFKTWSCYICLA